MNQCLNKLLTSLDQLYEALFQKIVEIFARRGIIRPLIRRPVVPILELQPIDNQNAMRQPLMMHSCTSTPVFAKSESIYRRAESEKDFRKCQIPNLGDTIYKVDSYSRDVSMLNLFSVQTEQIQHLDTQDNLQQKNNLQVIIEQKQEKQEEQQQPQPQQLSENSQEQLQFYSIVDNQNRITQTDQFFSIIDRSSFRHSFNKLQQHNQK